MTLLQKIRTSFSTQLSLWVAAFVVVTSGTVLFLLARFSREVIRDETTDTTLQTLENAALRIDNTLRLSEMAARQQGWQFQADAQQTDRLLSESRTQEMLRKTLPHVRLFVSSQPAVSSPSATAVKSGYRLTRRDGREEYVFTHAIGRRPLILSAVCPAADIYSRYSRMYYLLVCCGVGTVLVLLYVLYLIIATHLRPLHLLADAAQRIACGHLDTPIPDNRSQHEIGRLQTSLQTMQQSLVAYMDEMQQKQTTLSTRNAELLAAYEQAQAYEQKKARFLHEMAERMAPPVDRLCRSTDTICQQYARLSPADMSRLTADITGGTDEIIQLLDQLIKSPADA